MTETAADIIAEGQRVPEGEEEEETPSIEEEFRDLQTHMEGLEERLNKLATTLEQHGEEPASKRDVAQLYRFVTGDVVSSIKDLVAACGAAFNDAFELIESGESDDDDNTPSEEDIQVYTTFVANIEAFTNLSQTPGIPPAQKEAFEQMIALNQGNLDNFHEAYGEDAMKEAASKKMEEAARGGSTA